MKKLLLLSAIFASQTLMAQNVGIGITVPLAPLHIAAGASGNLTPFSPLVVEGINNTYINLLSPNTNETGLLFGKADNAASGAIVYNNVNTLNGFQFRTAGNITQMILNNTGNLGIGVSTPNAKLSISANGTELGGTAMSNNFRTNAGILGTNMGDELSLASIGFTGGGNNISLGIRAYRTSAASSWNSTAVLLGYDVDNTVRASTGFLALSANGNIGINTVSPHASAVLDVTSTTKGMLPPRMTQADRNNIANPVAGLTIWCKNCSVYGQMQVYNGLIWRNMIGGTPAGIPTIGDSDGGGIVAYILQPGDPGYIAGEVHGLIASISNLNGGDWGCSGSLIGTSTAIGAGRLNTTAIVNICGTAGIAARLCNDLVQNGYDDWYLPSKDELNQLYLNKNVIGGFTQLNYWSSSEFDANSAWRQNFNDGSGIQTTASKATVHFTRAVRSF